jgi:cyclic beta-1,2-glucan synthetase
MARGVMGDTARTWELFSMLNPIHHGADPEGISLHEVEPYVMAGDIHGCPQHLGRGGWNWYTSTPSRSSGPAEGRAPAPG